MSLSGSSREAERELYARGLAFCLGLPYPQSRDYANPSDGPPKEPQPTHNQTPPYPYNPTGAASVAGLGFVKGLVKGKALGDSSYGAPDSTYGAPDSSYGAPEATYGAPHQTYDTPDDTYSSPAPTYTPDVSYSQPEKDEYGSPSAPAIVELIKSEKLEEHPEVENEHLHENTVAEDEVSEITTLIMIDIHINRIIIDFGFHCQEVAKLEKEVADNLEKLEKLNLLRQILFPPL